MHPGIGELGKHCSWWWGLNLFNDLEQGANMIVKFATNTTLWTLMTGNNIEGFRDNKWE